MMSTLMQLCGMFLYKCSVSEDAADKHPEKRLKALFKAYEELHMPRIKAENPSMRLSQLKQLLFKEWTKSPDNPLNRQN